MTRGAVMITAQVATRSTKVAAPSLVSLTTEQHLAWIESPAATARGGVSFLQTPSWGRVKAGWEAESVGWQAPAGELVGAALVLSRAIPRTGRRLCYLPDGPMIDWASPDLDQWLDPLIDHLRGHGAFTIRVGADLEHRRWSPATVRSVVRHEGASRLRSVVPDSVDPLGSTVSDRLADRGWHRLADSAQPRYVVRLPLAQRRLGEVWDGLDSSWRRNIAKAKRVGVETSEGRAADLDDFYRLLEITQRRGGFDLGRRLPYYRHQFEAMNAERAGRLRLLLARHDGEVLSAHTMVTVGARAWYLNGANADRERSMRASNALQWSMIERAHSAGAATYDLRGVKDSLDPAGPHYGLLRWKLGTGGYVAETVGDWEIVLNRPLHAAYRAYLAHRR